MNIPELETIEVIEEIYTQIKPKSLLGLGLPLGLPFSKKSYKDKEEVLCLPHISTDTYLKAVQYEQKKIEKRDKLRDWKLINEKQAKQDLYAWDLISLAVDSLKIIQIKRVGAGRPSISIQDKLKLAILKVYNKSSFRKCYSFNLLYSNAGYTTKMVKRSCINNVFNDERYTDYLEKIYRSLANFLVPYENSFAIDSSGFGSRYVSRWVKVRTDFQKHKLFRKLHVVCGVHTHIVTDVKITEGSGADSPVLKELILSTSKRFDIRRVCADAGYLSRDNAQFIEDIDARPFIMPKKNTSARAKGHYPAWNRMIRLWLDCPGLFKKQYHLRSNVETVFSMMKTTLMDGLNCRKAVSQKNELLIRVVCHNLGVIIDSIFKWDIHPYT